MKKQKSEPPLVMIEWEDSVQPKPSWRFLCDLEEPEIIKCTSVGWLVNESPRVKELAPNIGMDWESSSFQACGIISIPTRAITRVIKLKEGPKYKFTC